MAFTYDNSVRKAALDGICPLFNSGFVKQMNASDEELASPVFGATAFGAATTANPSVATAAAMTKDETITAGTIAKVAFQSSATATLISGSCGTSGQDFVIDDDTIPGDAVSVNITGLTFSLTLS